MICPTCKNLIDSPMHELGCEPVNTLDNYINLMTRSKMQQKAREDFYYEQEMKRLKENQ